MRKTTYACSNLTTTEAFIGESIEEKVRRVEETNAPVESISPMYYNERKAGVEAATDLRTDKWDVALNAMDNIAIGTRKKREEKIKKAAEDVAKGNTENIG